MARVIHYTTGAGNLPYPDEDSDADIAQDFMDLANAVEGGYSTFVRGTKALRPTSSSSSHGKARRIYWAWDTGELFYDTGTSWELLNHAAGTAGGDLGGSYPNPTVHGAAGNFTVVGGSTFQGDSLFDGDVDVGGVVNADTDVQVAGRSVATQDWVRRFNSRRHRTGRIPNGTPVGNYVLTEQGSDVMEIGGPFAVINLAGWREGHTQGASADVPQTDPAYAGSPDWLIRSSIEISSTTPGCRIQGGIVPLNITRPSAGGAIYASSFGSPFIEVFDYNGPAANFQDDAWIISTGGLIFQWWAFYVIVSIGTCNSDIELDLELFMR